MKKSKILFISTNLKGGGAERMILNILLHLHPDIYKIYLVLFEHEGVYVGQVPAYVKKIFLIIKNKFNYIKIILLLAFKLFSGLKPDIVISFMILPNILTILSSLISLFKPKIIISIRNNPEMDFISQKKKCFKKVLMNILYPFASHIIVISKGIKNTLITNNNFKRDKIRVVYNGIDINYVQTLARKIPDDPLFQKKGCYYITACGRLTHQKGFFNLIKAFSLIKNRINAQLFIFGEGEERKNLENLIIHLHLNNKVFLPGFTPNPFQYIAHSDVFILSSLYEGFGNVIIEAMACGTPVISTDCPFGPGEIIEHGINGLLIPPDNIDTIADTLLSLLQNKSLRERLILEGKKRINDFSVIKMVNGYESLFSQILSNKKSCIIE